MDSEEARQIAERQRAYFNRAVEAFDVPQPADVLDRLEEVVAVAAIAPGETVLDASVDVVLMNAVYGNIADKPAAQRNVGRMLRPGGRLVVSHPEGRAFVDRLRAES